MTMGSTPSTNKYSSTDGIQSEILNSIKKGDKILLSKIKEKPELYKHLHQAILPSTVLHYAILYGQLEWVNYLIDQKFDINGLSEGNETPLHSCVRAKRTGLACAKIILKAKGDINAKNVWGRTPLMEAIVQFRYEIVDYLLAEGADVNIADDHKTTPLHVCASYGNLTCLKTMLARGANQNAQDERGRTSLYFAITGNHKEVVFYLIENGCNINIYDSNFGSPLQKALTMANLDLVQALLKAGASTNIYTTSKLTNIRLSLLELTFHTILVSLEVCSSNEENWLEVSASYGPAAKAQCHIQCFKLLSVAHGFPIQKNVKDRLKHILVKCKVEDLKKELVKLQQLVNAMSKPQTRKGPVDSLQNLARFHSRQYLMASRRNVIWSCDQMDIPTVLVKILTFRL